MQVYTRDRVVTKRTKVVHIEMDENQARNLHAQLTHALDKRQSFDYTHDLEMLETGLFSALVEKP